MIQRSGIRIEQGWRAACVNGLVFLGPFHRVFALGVDGDTRLSGAAARQARRRFLQRSPSVRRAVWGPAQRAFLVLLSIPCTLLAFLASLLTLPLFAAVWLLWLAASAFWSLALVIARLALRLASRPLFTRKPHG